MAANERGSLPLSCRADPLRLALRRPRVADRFGGPDQAPPNCGGVTPECVQHRVLVVPGFQARKCRLVDPTTPGHGAVERNNLATALPVRPQRVFNVNSYSIAVNSFGSMVFQRQPSVTPTPRGIWESRFESWIPSFACYFTEPATGSGRRFAEVGSRANSSGHLPKCGHAARHCYCVSQGESQ